MSRPSLIPAGSWPLEMRAETAAAYCDEPSVDAFLLKVQRGLYSGLGRVGYRDPRSMRFVLHARCRWCLWAPGFIHCGYYQRSSCKIAFVWIAVQVTKHHVRFLTHRHPWRRAAGVRSFAGELATKIDGVRNPSDESDAEYLAPSHFVVCTKS